MNHRGDNSKRETETDGRIVYRYVRENQHTNVLIEEVALLRNLKQKQCLIW